jgi:uncharacterized protein
MGKTVIADTGFLVALLAERDRHKGWALAMLRLHEGPWLTCEAVISEVFFLMHGRGDRVQKLWELMRRGILEVRFELAPNLIPVLKLQEKYVDLPMALADACLVRMTELLPDPLVLTTDQHFRIYRRAGRVVVPSVMPDDHH